MAFKYGLSSVEFSGGSKTLLPTKGITLFVGPNNVGKSRCLRELAARVGGADVTEFIVTRSIEEQRDGTGDEFYEWLAARYRILTQQSGNQSLVGIGVGIGTGPIKPFAANLWGTRPGLQALGLTVASHLVTGQRLSDADPAPAYDAVEGHATEALHALYVDEALEARLSTSFRRAFAQDLVVDRLGGAKIALRCGQRPDPKVLGGELSMAFARAVRSLSLLHEQGDGMRSYVACLLHTDVRERPIVLIDEPEAFLHPPQARVLAHHLARAAVEHDRQVIVATHSSDIVRGALDGGVDVSVVRLTRRDGTNFADQLDAKSVRTVWEDPLLRASNLLDALFHTRLILCEGDGDCRFYNAVLEGICDEAKQTRPDIMFAHTSGKDRLPTAVRAMRALAVPVSVIADVDVLRAEHPLRSIWEGLGGAWEEVFDLRRRVHAAVEATAKKPGREYFRERVLQIVDSSTDATIDDDVLERVRSLLRSEGGWQAVKRGGLDAIPKGDARRDADALLRILAGRGLHVVPVGELEGFAPHLGSHGPAWVAKALALDLVRGVETARARDFVRSLGLLTEAPTVGESLPTST